MFLHDPGEGINKITDFAEEDEVEEAVEKEFR